MRPGEARRRGLGPSASQPGELSVPHAVQRQPLSGDQAAGTRPVPAAGAEELPQVPSGSRRRRELPRSQRRPRATAAAGRPQAPPPPPRACAARAAARADGRGLRVPFFPGTGPLGPHRGGGSFLRVPGVPLARRRRPRAPGLRSGLRAVPALGAASRDGSGGRCRLAAGSSALPLGGRRDGASRRARAAPALRPLGAGGGAEGGGAGPTRRTGPRPRRWGAGPAGRGGSRRRAVRPPRPCRTRRPKFPRRCSERSSTTRWATSTRRYRAAPARRPAALRVPDPYPLPPRARARAQNVRAPPPRRPGCAEAGPPGAEQAGGRRGRGAGDEGPGALEAGDLGRGRGLGYFREGPGARAWGWAAGPSGGDAGDLRAGAAGGGRGRGGGLRDPRPGAGGEVVFRTRE